MKPVFTRRTARLYTNRRACRVRPFCIYTGAPDSDQTLLLDAQSRQRLLLTGTLDGLQNRRRRHTKKTATAAADYQITNRAPAIETPRDTIGPISQRTDYLPTDPINRITEDEETNPFFSITRNWDRLNHRQHNPVTTFPSLARYLCS